MNSGLIKHPLKSYMRKAESTASENIIAVSVVSFGNDPVAVALPVGATVAQALSKAGVVRGSQELFVSGESASDADILENGDVLSIVTPKQAGAR